MVNRIYSSVYFLHAVNKKLTHEIYNKDTVIVHSRSLPTHCLLACLPLLIKIIRLACSSQSTLFPSLLLTSSSTLTHCQIVVVSCATLQHSSLNSFIPICVKNENCKKNKQRKTNANTPKWMNNVLFFPLKTYV